MSALGAVSMMETWNAPRGTVIQMRGVGVLIHPSDLMRLRNNGRTPLWSERTIGGKESRRDVRRYEGDGRNRTGVYGFAGRRVTTPPRRQNPNPSEAR